MEIGRFKNVRAAAVRDLLSLIMYDMMMTTTPTIVNGNDGGDDRMLTTAC